MRIFKLINVILFILVCATLESCLTLQQPLPGSLWGNWAFKETGVLSLHGNNLLEDYWNVCTRSEDRLHFSSDRKMTLRWYDESCTINQYFIGYYHVDGKILNIELAAPTPFQDSPFPPITKYRIMEINDTTLHLEEIPHGDRKNRDRGRSGFEPLVYVFMKLN